MHPKHCSAADFTYDLPEHRIAKHPLQERDASRLLVYRQGNISDSTVKHLPGFLPEGALLVFNDSKVISARVLFQKSSGGIIEIFVLEPESSGSGLPEALDARGSVLCHCLVGGASKWKKGMDLHREVTDETGQVWDVTAHYKAKEGDATLIEFRWQPDHQPFSRVLDLMGEMPLPPYMRRRAAVEDTVRYQTVYARSAGSVAAPTAGLHFTPQVFAGLEARQIASAFVTLHVGAGTFKPVKADTMEGHDMHAEWLDVSREIIIRLMQETLILPVGTTSMRTLESLYWMGVKTLIHPEITFSKLEMGQWEVYEELAERAVSAQEALGGLLGWMDRQQMSRLIIKTRLLIAPGYRFHMSAGLITNFHQPGSTLLLLVAALVGEDWKKIYAYALENDFRFLSYGDSSLLLP